MKNVVTAFIAVAIIFFSSCAKKTATCIGIVKTDCICTQQYDPVCGCDGKTYGNACTANCAGVKSWTKGECK